MKRKIQNFSQSLWAFIIISCGTVAGNPSTTTPPDKLDMVLPDASSIEMSSLGGPSSLNLLSSTCSETANLGVLVCIWAGMLGISIS